MSENFASSINEFRDSILNEIALSVLNNSNTNPMEEFMEYVAGELIEAEEFDEFHYVGFEGTVQNSRKFQVDGYSYNELENSLCLFLGIPLSYGEETTFIASQANTWIGRVIAFIENAAYILQRAEESAPGYGLAYDIIHTYNSVQRYKLYIFTDRIMSKKLDEIQGFCAAGKPVECHVWDITRLYELSHSASGKEEIVINFDELGLPNIPCMLASETDNYHAYLCNIPGLSLAELYNKYGGKLLEGNVRSFLQLKGAVNKGIRKTILTDPEMFFAYNNGIAATAHEIKTTNLNGMTYITEIKSLQIVNGGQTTATLANSLLNDKKDNSVENIKRINVPMKLSIVIPDKSDELIAHIAEYANKQNKVSSADLWSNHPFHIRLEDFSRRILAPATNGRQYGTHWYYERAKGQYQQETYKCTPGERERFFQRNPKSQMFNKTELAKYMLIHQQNPHLASAGGEKAFGKFASGIDQQWKTNDADFNEAYFRTVVAMAILFREADSIVKKEPWYNSYKANIVAYTIAKILHTVTLRYPEMTISYRDIWQKQRLSDSWVKQIKKTSLQMYNHLIDPNRLVENVTEWAKREACWTAAKKLNCELLPEFVAELQTTANAAADKKKAKDEQKLTNNLNAIIEVVDYGANSWQALWNWDMSHKVLQPPEKKLVKSAIVLDGGLLSSERQCKTLLKALERCRLEGFPG